MGRPTCRPRAAVKFGRRLTFSREILTHSRALRAAPPVFDTQIGNHHGTWFLDQKLIAIDEALPGLLLGISAKARNSGQAAQHQREADKPHDRSPPLEVWRSDDFQSGRSIIARRGRLPA